MVRKPAAERLAAVAEAATRVFGRLGYRGTRTADVATQAGLSTGSLFTYVESKEALFHLVFAHGFGQYAENVPDLPLVAPPFTQTVELIATGLRRHPVPRFRAALAEPSPRDVAAELRGIVEERYDMFEELWPVLAVIERCAPELPELEDLYYGRARVGYHTQLGRYLDKRAAAGLFRPMPDPAVAARVVSEAIVWFAWHRREGRDAALYDDAVVRHTVVEFVCAALLPERVR